MSSILDSLKKLEKETARQDHLVFRAKVGEKKASIPKYAIGITVFMGICVGVLGLAAYYRGSPQQIPALPAGDPALPTGPAAVPDEPKMPPAPEQGPAVMRPSTPAGGNAAADADALEMQAIGGQSTSPLVSTEDPYRQPGAGSAPEPAAVLTAGRGEDRQEAQAVKTSAPHDTTPAATASEKPEALPVKTPATELEREEGPLAIDKLAGVGIKIQAISWSDIPEKSLAVINNRVLRAGDEIEGYQITRINPDDVVLQRGGKSFRLEFRSSGAQ